MTDDVKTDNFVESILTEITNIFFCFFRTIGLFLFRPAYMVRKLQEQENIHQWIFPYTNLLLSSFLLAIQFGEGINSLEQFIELQQRFVSSNLSLTSVLLTAFPVFFITIMISKLFSYFLKVKCVEIIILNVSSAIMVSMAIFILLVIAFSPGTMFYLYLYLIYLVSLTGVVTWKVKVGGGSKAVVWFRKFCIGFALTTIPYLAISTELFLSLKKESKKWVVKSVEYASFIDNLTDYEIHVVYRNISNELQIIDSSQLQVEFFFQKEGLDQDTQINSDTVKTFSEESLLDVPKITARPVKVESDGKPIEYMIINSKKFYAFVLKGTVNPKMVGFPLNRLADIKFFIKIVSDEEGEGTKVMRYGPFDLPFVFSEREKSQYFIE